MENRNQKSNFGRKLTSKNEIFEEENFDKIKIVDGNRHKDLNFAQKFKILSKSKISTVYQKLKFPSKINLENPTKSKKGK